ncbi:nuclease-related domain-containing protein [Bacillus tuaregi]|uniref:nuclease-related domain-containing protein n=1 Tax=Bacillus tuaregi TaxID=1816695 RepID=UPI0008F959ED|nr:nuclease-related domain-containing protein [Bacillus tuaregi]
MPYKSRTEPIELLIMESLYNRVELSEKEQKQYSSLKKGYKGEVLFDKLTETLQCDCLILNDLRLRHHSTYFQLDSLIIMADKIFLYEIKNYEGDYFFEADKFYMRPKTEINNPLTQLSRSESLLRQLILSLGYNLPLEASVVFINSECTLYQVPLNKPIIFPTQIHRHLNKLNLFPSQLKNNHYMLADKLVNLHIKNSPHTSLPSYDYHQLQKGILCDRCHSFSISIEGNYCICQDCSEKETVEKAVLRNVKEFKMLFPDQKITTSVIHNWCQVVMSKKRIKRILGRNFNIIEKRRWTYYE